MIYQLKRAGVNQNDFVKIYVYVFRPVVEYACPTWHMNLLAGQHRDNAQFVKTIETNSTSLKFMQEQQANPAVYHVARIANRLDYCQYWLLTTYQY